MNKFFCVAFILLMWIHAGVSDEKIDVIRSDRASIIVEIQPFDLTFSDVRVDGTLFQQVQTDNDLLLMNDPGFPQLPFLSELIGLPFSGKAEVRVLDAQFEDFTDVDIAAAPVYDFVETESGGYFEQRYQPQRPVYESDTFFPTALGEIKATQIFRQHKVGKLHIYPVQYNPRRNILRTYNRLKIEVVFTPGQQDEKSGEILPEHKAFRKVLEKSLLNYPQAKKWKKPPDVQKVSLATDWYDPGKNYYKLLITRDGLYRLSYNDLFNDAVDIIDFNPKTIKIFNRGEQIPIRVRGEDDGVFSSEDFIEFFAGQNYGEKEYYADYSDTNVYWLTAGGAEGKRFGEQFSLAGEFEELNDFRKTVHAEKDLTYFHGDPGQIIKTEKVSGEGWIWKEFFPGDENELFCYLRHVNTQSTDLCSLKVKLRGITTDDIYPDHHAQFKFNGHEIGSVTFDGFEEKIFSTTFEASFLQQNWNRLKVKSVDTGALINKFYVDWYELSFPASLENLRGEVRFAAPEDEEATVSLWNIESPLVSAYNLTKEKWIADPLFRNEQRYIIRLLSAGFDDGNYAQIQINSENIIDGGLRGHNIVVFDTTTGTVDDQKYFDTLDKHENSDSMAAFISRIPGDKLVLVAIRDEGSYRMTEAGYLALESVGAELARQVGWRDSYVLLGRKIAAPGSVPELLVPAGQGQAVLTDTLFAYNAGSKHFQFSSSFQKGDELLIVSSDSLKKPDAIIADQFQGLKNQTNSADYIFIYHEKFRQVADRFAQYWGQRGLRTKLVAVTDIYDEFNFGIKHPQAIKDFLNFAYSNWEKAAPSFVMLIGDASWDPKLNAISSKKRDYVPTWGSPVSDNWFVCFDGADDLLPEMFIGRLAIETVEEGERVFRKVENYQQTPSEEWKKQVLMINGGFNDYEQTIFTNQSRGIVEKYVEVPPASCEAQMISKELDGLYEGEKREEIIAAINGGKLWVNFIGHGGSGTWELMFHDEQIFRLENTERLPFVTSFTCHTGRFANPEMTNFCENFVNYSDAGAIGFVGSSGWGFVHEDKLIAEKLFETVLKDTVHQQGEALATAKIGFWAATFPNDYSRSIMQQYSLLGDPAVNLALPEQPDLLMKESGVTLIPELPSETDSLALIKCKVYNYGLATNDSVRLKVTDHFIGHGSNKLFDNLIPPVGFRDSVEISLPVSQKAGEHLLVFNLDSDKKIAEANETNNDVNYPFFVSSSRFTISLPQKNEVVTDGSIRLQINNPVNQHPDEAYYFEIDTTDQFNSPALKSSNETPQGLIVTKWTPGNLEEDVLYFWRCRSAGDDLQNYWQGSNFRVANNFGWLQNDEQQFSTNEFDQVETGTSGIRLLQNEIVFRVESGGFHDSNYAILFINFQPVSTATRGHNLAVCDEYGSFIKFKKFDTHDSAEDVAEMVTFLNGIEPGYYVLAGIMDSGVQAMTEAAYQALESIGSQYCRDVAFRDSWAIIGKKGAPIGSVPEQHSPKFNGPAIVEDTLFTFESSGSLVSTEVGPANSWGELKWSGEFYPPSTEVRLDVLGFNKTTSQWDTVRTDLTNKNGVSLSSLDAAVYPKIKLKGNFSTQDALVTPELERWQVTFDPVSDVAISDKTIWFDADTLIDGGTLNISGDVYNVGYVLEDSVQVAITLKNANQEETEITNILLSEVGANSKKAFSYQWNSLGNVGRNRIYIRIDPSDEINELNENNNLCMKPVIVLPDTAEPRIQVSYDGKQIIQHDYVSQNPIIHIKVFDNNPADISSDTSRFHLLLDGERIRFSNNESTVQLVPVSNDEDSLLQAYLQFTPRLTDGQHTLEVFVKDASDNPVYHRDDFQVISELKILDVLNYPNPFAESTNFTFYLTQPADDVVMKFFTTSGRLFQRIELFGVGAGYQQVYWDGRDMDGDRLANGVYLYKIIVKSNNTQVEQIKKFVVMR